MTTAASSPGLTTRKTNLAVTSMSSSMTENEKIEEEGGLLLFSKNNNNSFFSGNKQQQRCSSNNSKLAARRVSSYKDFGIVTNNESNSNSRSNSFIRFVPKQSSIDDPTSVQSIQLSHLSTNSPFCNNNLM